MVDIMLILKYSYVLCNNVNYHHFPNVKILTKFFVLDLIK